MTQIPDLLNDFDTAIAAIGQRLSEPKVSEAEQNLTQELEQAGQKMATLEASLAEQKTNFLNMSEEYGAMELSLKSLQEDDTAKQELETLTQQMDSLKSTSEDKISELRNKNNDLQSKLDEALKTAADAKSNAMDDIKEQHTKDIAEVQNILNQLKPLVEE